ncbi:uncharacterized protein LDX57_003048 [Aspergillus melleus]|uniref:uncharacterized protein n=1 Tax=Aspergillus melleus TaxID=138277 RepID=UPI001E8D6F76|nr:uncharacterized protein LDX57_003048 [Aspergillus melleus]KAH8425289.1 hypothetical protein LDX57_003048 [Aspergillus melleus]
MDSTSSNSSSKRSTLTHTTTKTGESRTVYDPDLEVHLIDHGIFPPSALYPDGTELSKPENLAEIQRHLRVPHPSLALSEDSLRKKYKETTIANNRAIDKQMVIINVLSILDGPQYSLSFHAGGNHLFTNLAPLTDGTLANAKPDFYDGAPPIQLNLRTREQLSDQITPTRRSDRDRPIAPTFFVEVNGKDGSPAALSLQALYDGALGARAMHSLQRYGNAHEERDRLHDCDGSGPAHAHAHAHPNTHTHDSDRERDPDYDNHAYTMTCTFQAGTLGIYVTHPTRAPSNADPARQTDYVMTQVGHYSLIGSPESYQQGLTAYRNSRELAKKYRDEFVRRANERCAAEYFQGRVQDADNADESGRGGGGRV